LEIGDEAGGESARFLRLFGKSLELFRIQIALIYSSEKVTPNFSRRRLGLSEIL